ncbi:dihydroorotate dehydrogenase electron transfer subunit [Bacillus mesophilus]|uniref:Dihydroorotate dehydrogenase B (NAD(+)), electron transfer subunit n=1 Tax=Bacillus mesophilus TaxID=1808955 RepID=A0A6M0Q4B9_9BACI|nr:dihydroorotate dehydrogenase electron transfer subunit [Bacillus mesophilus]NEY70300.1 dihydroorotate dehydrogenase electron transfer subunit [Bacillus mesophilus]
MIQQEWMTIIEQKTIAKDIFELTVQGNMVDSMKEPGQFVHIKVSPGAVPLLRRPISICSVDSVKQQFTMLYRRDGLGTSTLSERVAGDQINILGPLGNGFPIEATQEGETALLVGGGIGVPPLYELSKQLVKKGVKVIHVLGFQSIENTFYESEFRELGETYVATVDGTYGTPGFVTDVIERYELTFDTLYSCGPTPMLRALEERYKEARAYLSLEERMGCGIGACFACVCRVQNDETGYAYKKVCSDGPVFPIGEVVL